MEGREGLSIIIFMQLKAQNMTLLRRGCNSELLLVQEAEMSVVIKAVPVGSVKEVKHLLNEWNILNKLFHENIVEAYRLGKEVALPGREGNFCLLAQEHARHGNLLDLIKKGGLSVEQRRLLFWEVGQALLHLHSNSIVHRDIKLDNILIFDHEEQEGEITAKLADFGFAAVLRSDQTLLNSFKGTRRGYMAPEIHGCREDPNKYYDPKAADMFALGVVLFAVVLGRLPFEFALPSDKLYGHLAEGRSQEFWASHTAALNKLEAEEGAMTAEFQKLFENLVKMQPQERLTMEEVVVHPWSVGRKERAHL